jgi:hypothetical protein
MFTHSWDEEERAKRLFEMVFFIAFAVVGVGFFVYVLIQFHRDSSSRRPRRH